MPPVPTKNHLLLYRSMTCSTRSMAACGCFWILGKIHPETVGELRPEFRTWSNDHSGEPADDLAKSLMLTSMGGRVGKYSFHLLFPYAASFMLRTRAIRSSDGLMGSNPVLQPSSGSLNQRLNTYWLYPGARRVTMAWSFSIRSMIQLVPKQFPAGTH